jgi:two-component system OmpR family response regulator
LARACRVVKNTGVPRLLVVDEYPPLATVMAIGLRRAGHDVVRVGSAQRAEAAEGEFALAVIDIELPDADGVALAERLLASAATRAVVFFTASRDATSRARAERVGVVVDKNEGLERLVEVVRARLAEDRVALAMPDTALPERESGRSGTRRRVR